MESVDDEVLSELLWSWGGLFSESAMIEITTQQEDRLGLGWDEYQELKFLL